MVCSTLGAYRWVNGLSRWIVEHQHFDILLVKLLSFVHGQVHEGHFHTAVS